MRDKSIEPRRWVVARLGQGFMFVKSSLLLFDLLVHQISPQRQLGPSRDIVTGMQQVAMLEDEDSADLWIDVQVFVLIPGHGVKPCRPTCRPGSRSSFFRLIEVEMEGIEGYLLSVRGHVRSITVCWTLDSIICMRSRFWTQLTSKVLTLGVLQEPHPLIQPAKSPGLSSFDGSVPSNTSLVS